MPGACSGCGVESASCSKIVSHITQCDDYAKLYQRAPELCFPPAEAYVRKRAEEQDPELRATRREERLNRIFADVDVRRQRETDRFRGKPDMLADDDEELVR